MSAVAELVSSVAVVITLAYLAVQTQQLRNTLEGSSREALLAGEIEFAKAMIDSGDGLLAGYKTGTTEADNARLLGATILTIRTREYAWVQFKRGSIDEETMNSYMRVAAMLFGRPGYRGLWAVNKEMFDPEFVAYVDGLIAEMSR